MDAAGLKAKREDVAARGTTVLYTTHYLEEAETLCDRIGILDHGKLLAEGTLDELKRMVGEQEVVTLKGSFDAARVRAEVAGIPGVEVLGEEEGRMVLAAGVNLSRWMLSASMPIPWNTGSTASHMGGGPQA